MLVQPSVGGVIEKEAFRWRKHPPILNLHCAACGKSACVGKEAIVGHPVVDVSDRIVEHVVGAENIDSSDRCEPVAIQMFLHVTRGITTHDGIQKLKSWVLLLYSPHTQGEVHIFRIYT